MSDRSNSKKRSLRDDQAAKRAAIAGQQTTNGTPATSTSEGSNPSGQELTEPGTSFPRWFWWVLAGVIIGACAYGLVHFARYGTAKERMYHLETLADQGSGVSGYPLLLYEVGDKKSQDS